MSHQLARKNSNPSAQRTFSAVLFSLLLFTSALAGSSEYVDPAPSIFSKCWEYPAHPNLDVGVAANASSAYFLDDENKLHGVDLAAGNKLWSTEVGGTVVSNLLILEDSILLVTSSQSESLNAPIRGTIQSISRKTGVTGWSTEIASSPKTWLGSGSGTVVAVGSDGLASAFSSANGTLIWKTDLSSKVSATPYFHASGIEIATSKNEVLNVSGSDGRVRVNWKSKYLPTVVLLEAKGRLVVGDERGSFISVSSNGDQIWGFRNGAQISSASLYRGYYLVASYDNFVYKLSRSGDVKWKRRLSGRVNDGPLVLGDTAIVSIVGSGNIYVLDLKNGKISHRIETGDEVSLRVATASNGPAFVVAGPRSISYLTSVKCPVK